MSFPGEDNMANESHPGGLQKMLDTGASIATIIAAIAVVTVIGLNWTRLAGQRRSPSPEAQGRSKQGRATVTKLDGLETTAGELAKHHPGAKVAIVEFSDFQCPYCGQYAREVYPKVQHELVEAGVADYVFRNFPLEQIHPLALKASEAAECAGQQGKYWEMHDQLFANQQQLEPKGLLSSARALGLNLTTFRGCLDGKTATRIREDEAEGRRLGVTSTPTFLIGLIEPNGKIRLVQRFSGAEPFDMIKAQVDAVLVAKAEVRQ
jgi:protein-disulfide isomerase